VARQNLASSPCGLNFAARPLLWRLFSFSYIA